MLSRIRRGSLVGLLVGITGLTVLVAWQGWTGLAARLGQAGWQLLWLPGYFALPLVLATAAWRWLWPAGQGPRLSRALYAVWLGSAVNWLLPVAQVGGEILRARLLVQWRYALAPGIASLVADKTVQVLTQVLFALLGLALFVYITPSPALAWASLAGAGLLTILVGIFYRLQQRGLFTALSRRAARLWPTSEAAWRSQAEAVDAALVAVYERRRRLLMGIVLRLAFRLALAGEIYLALHFLGQPVSVLEAMILESMAQTVRAAAFLIPGGIGAQEGVLVAVGMALGLPPDIALAMALAKRVRELVVGLPGLLLWQLSEWRRLARQGDSLA